MPESTCKGDCDKVQRTMPLKEMFNVTQSSSRNKSHGTMFGATEENVGLE